MFILPNKIVREIIERRLKYGEVPKSSENEDLKKQGYSNQALINLNLEKRYSCVCSVLEQECRKKECSLFRRFRRKNFDSWVCLEYKADFPEASFDLRSNVTLIGADSVDYEKSLANLEKLKELGARYICAHCFETYKEKPTQVVEDTQDWGLIIMCWCGSEEFYEIDDFVRLNKLNHFKS